MILVLPLGQETLLDKPVKHSLVLVHCPQRLFVGLALGQQGGRQSAPTQLDNVGLQTQ